MTDIDTDRQKRQQAFEAIQHLFELDQDVMSGTVRLFEAEDAVNANAAGPMTVAALRTIPEAAALFDERWTLPAIDLAAMQQLPEGSFGRIYADYMVSTGFDPNYVISLAPVEVTDDLTYFTYLWRTTHDFHHLAANIGTDGRGEVALQAFLAGQMPNAFSLIVVCSAILRSAVATPQEAAGLLDAVSKAYGRGRRSPHLLYAQRWDRFFALPLEEVRRQLEIAAD